jgi:hypothetical protein
MESPYTLPVFRRTWIDETYHFSVDAIRSTLRPAGVKVDDLGTNYGWYADAVPVDAILPPGVPLSAKEIIAFYPHHICWKDIKIRLTNNGYKGVDIMGMQVSRDRVGSVLSDFS